MRLLKRILFGLCLAALPVAAQMQTDYFDAFYGGGIGYTPTWVSLPSIDLPQTPEGIDFSGNTYLHGVQGWGTISDHWRLGASVLAGKKQRSENIASTDSVMYSQMSLSSSLLFVEYVFPVSAHGQFALNLSAGISNYSYKYLRNRHNNDWAAIFAKPEFGARLTAKSAPTFLPEISWLWQFMRRGGLRFNAGAHIALIPPTAWKVDDYYTVSNSPGGGLMTLVSPFAQVFIYFGL